MHTDPGTPPTVTHDAPAMHPELSAQRTYWPLGGFGLHWGHEAGGMHAHPPPDPSQQRIPKALHVLMHEVEQSQGRAGRGPGVGGPSGTGEPFFTLGYAASIAMPQIPVALTFRFMLI